MFLWIILCNIPLTQQRFQPSWFKVLPSALPIFIRFYPYIMKFWKHGKNCLPWSNFLQSDCKRLHTFEPLYNGHLGDRRKWPLLRGGYCREVLNKESMCEIFCLPWLKKSGPCREVALSAGSTVLHFPILQCLTQSLLWTPLQCQNAGNAAWETPDPSTQTPPRGPLLRYLYEYLRC